MQQIRIIKKYVTSDGIEFLCLDAATEHQIKIEALSKQLKVGAPVKFCNKNYGGCVSYGNIKCIEPPFITIEHEKGSYSEHYIPDIVIVPVQQD